MTLAVHCAPRIVGRQSGGPASDAGTLFASGTIFASSMPMSSPQTMPWVPNDGMWHLECIFAAGFSPEEFLALPMDVRKLSLLLEPGGLATVLGRQNHPQFF